MNKGGRESGREGGERGKKGGKERVMICLFPLWWVKLLFDSRQKIPENGSVVDLHAEF